MRAPTEAFTYRYTHYGDADVLKRHQYPLPAPGPGEVLVEVISTAINHMDAFLRNGKEDTWHDDPWPRASGCDFAGIVRAVGPGVTEYRAGADVVGHTRTGAHAFQQLSADAGALVLGIDVQLVELHFAGLGGEHAGRKADRKLAHQRQLPPRVAAFELASYHLGPITLIEHVFYLRDADDARVVRVPHPVGECDQPFDLSGRQRTHA